jgi:hypothetical protein
MHPVFEIKVGEKHYATFADGSTTGFGENPYIQNRIPVLITEVRAGYRSSPNAIWGPENKPVSARSGTSQGTP